MKVTLLAYTPTPEHLVTLSAKLCYSSSGVADLEDGLTAEKEDSFVQMLSEIGHESPLEHASFTFGIEGVSRSLLAQITRHRIASFSVKSQRYIKESAFDYVVPPAIAEDEQALQVYNELMGKIETAYEQLTTILKNNLAHLPNKKAEKTAIEDARFVLPNACATSIICTMNARSLLHFFQLRCCNRAQWEIRSVANEMLRLVYPLAPHLFSKAGPPCVSGSCKEGKMTCGEMDAVRTYYADLKKGAV